MDAVVVDSHNEVLPYWIKQFLCTRHPSVVVRIDKHHDMSHYCPVLPAKEGRSTSDYFAKMMPQIYEYAKRMLNEGNFTCPAFHYGLVGALYHCNPEKKKIDAYGRILGSKFSSSPKTVIKSVLIGGKKIDRIMWDGARTKLWLQGGNPIPVPESLPFESFEEDIKNSRAPIIICFDLDGLYGLNESGKIEEIVGRRLDKARIVLDCITAPVLACIARSQTPRAYVPPEIVDQLQETVQRLIERKCHGLYKQVFLERD